MGDALSALNGEITKLDNSLTDKNAKAVTKVQKKVDESVEKMEKSVKDMKTIVDGVIEDLSQVNSSYVKVADSVKSNVADIEKNKKLQSSYEFLLKRNKLDQKQQVISVSNQLRRYGNPAPKSLKRSISPSEFEEVWFYI